MAKKNADRRFTKDHEWVQIDGDIVTVGITDHAQDQLGELVFIELPAPEREVVAAEACAVVESVKAASEVYAPLSGKVVEINQGVVDSPASLNTDPYGVAWLLKVELSKPAEAEALLDATAYEHLIKES